jgi:hypothetical protein
MTEVEVRLSLLTPHLRTRLKLSADRVEGTIPNTIFGLIPAGRKTVTQPLRGISHVSVDTKMQPISGVFGLLFLLLAFIMFQGGGGSAVFAVLVALLGLSLFALVLRAEMVISDASGSKLTVLASFVDREQLEGFARAVNDAVA